MPHGVDETTLSLDPAAVAEGLPRPDITGPALVVRAGGGREGEVFSATGGRTTIGRSPDCDIFLDDVTVSRVHAEVIRLDDTFTIRDLGSLNGTFVNRRRIDQQRLEEDDEVQIGKYRMTFLA
jgi:pSer/pThr/pTyr-binding forkhead associated (FHA) protein